MCFKTGSHKSTSVASPRCGVEMRRIQHSGPFFQWGCAMGKGSLQLTTAKHPSVLAAIFGDMLQASGGMLRCWAFGVVGMPWEKG